MLRPEPTRAAINLMMHVPQAKYAKAGMNRTGSDGDFGYWIATKSHLERFITNCRPPVSHSRPWRTLMGVTDPAQTRDEEFSRCFEQEMPRLLRYAQRHVGHELAQDVVAETFQIAWRKWDKLPDEKFPWLVGTARKVSGNHVRSTIRRRRLAARLSLLAEATADSTVSSIERHEALTRLAALTESEREALLLVAWDGLASADAAAVLGISPAAFRQRLSRARRTVLATEQVEWSAELTSETEGQR